VPFDRTYTRFLLHSEVAGWHWEEAEEFVPCPEEKTEKEGEREACSR